jgi:hypothetical protein
VGVAAVVLDYLVKAVAVLVELLVLVEVAVAEVVELKGKII